MLVTETNLKDVLVFEPKVFGDKRGSFFESYNHKFFTEVTGNKYSFVQDNQSSSMKGVLRGLHFQNPPHAQGKLVRVLQGRALDVVVDIRKNSATYGKHFSIELTPENNKQLWIPPGFAHGFISLEEDTIFAYKCTEYYAPQSEMTIKWNDKNLNIDWGMKPLLVSEKDELGLDFCNFVSLFE